MFSSPRQYEPFFFLHESISRGYLAVQCILIRCPGTCAQTVSGFTARCFENTIKAQFRLKCFHT